MFPRQSPISRKVVLTAMAARQAPDFVCPEVRSPASGLSRGVRLLHFAFCTECPGYHLGVGSLILRMGLFPPPCAGSDAS